MVAPCSAPRRKATRPSRLAASTHVFDATELYAREDGEVGDGTDNHAFNAGSRMTR